MGPVGRLIDTRLMPPSLTNVGHSAFLEFNNDASARRFGLLALQNHYIVLGKAIWHCELVAPMIGTNGPRPLPPNATRVLVINGPRDHKMMNVGALGDFLDHRTLTKSPENNVKTGGTIQDSCIVRDRKNGTNSVTIEWAFTSWRRGANVVRANLKKFYPELTVTYGRDPCE